ncbi:lipopolysaccharide biosynthesis protein [Fusobacterium varium]|uniref:Polysaccharide biosynthesis protein n=1 Tax=Fusobacterium varium ATCC 27725 TaxID=469618 RepID=A0ABN5JHD5_FUSVA|nr:oligosaccharide flippase family protein [Fusobacterium varium]AVQ31586.1 polysaccharide biosynthesis protein [Fusobacterium varium ATCC 27725]EES62925.1 polysaccharide biosynthesis protein [Fusobacterium varium ATCC 27725]VEH39615.1 Polysaccharide biosynthesis protein [Fusobacterium varium]
MKKEIILNFIFTIMINLLGFLQNRYFVRYMGMDSLGMMKLFSQLLAYLNIIELGLGSASAFALYKPLAERNYHQISIIVNTIENIYNKIGILLFGMGVLCIPIIPFFIEISKFTNEIYLYWILYLLNTVSTYLFIKYVILFTANQEFLYVRTIQSVSIVCFKIFQIICIIKFHSFFIYILLLILDNLTQWVFFRKHYKKKYSYIIKTKEKYEEIKNDIKNLFWHKIGSLVVFNTDLILISKFIDLKTVGIYASYQMITQVLSTIVSILSSLFSPKIGKYIAEHTKQENYICFKKYNILYCFISLILAYCTFILMNSFVALWLGNNFILSKFTLRLICFNLWVVLFRGNLEIFKLGTGFFDDVKSPILESIINLVISIVLGLKLGLDGVIIGTIASNVIIILIYKPILTFERCFEKNIKDYIKTYGNYLLLIIFSLVLSKLLLNYIPIIEIYTWVDWLKKAVLISSIVSTITLVIFIFDKDFREGIFIAIKKNK